MKIKKPSKMDVARKLVKARRMYKGAILSEKDVFMSPKCYKQQTKK